MYAKLVSYIPGLRFINTEVFGSKISVGLVYIKGTIKKVHFQVRQTHGKVKQVQGKVQGKMKQVH